jgi:hypothetical protein
MKSGLSNREVVIENSASFYISHVFRGPFLMLTIEVSLPLPNSSFSLSCSAGLTSRSVCLYIWQAKSLTRLYCDQKIDQQVKVLSRELGEEETEKKEKKNFAASFLCLQFPGAECLFSHKGTEMERGARAKM